MVKFSTDVSRYHSTKGDLRLQSTTPKVNGALSVQACFWMALRQERLFILTTQNIISEYLYLISNQSLEVLVQAILSSSHLLSALLKRKGALELPQFGKTSFLCWATIKLVKKKKEKEVHCMGAITPNEAYWKKMQISICLSTKLMWPSRR